MSEPTWQTSWDNELQDLFRIVAAAERAADDREMETTRRKIQRQNRRTLDTLATVDPENIDSRHRAKYRQYVHVALWVSLLTEPVVMRRISELVKKTGRMLTPEETCAAVLHLLRTGAKPKAKKVKAGRPKK
jgi:hypothetical protein